MQNIEGQIVDSYVPRKCSATGRLITPKDHAATQINVGKVDVHGNYTGEFVTFAIAGKVRARGEGDAALNCLATDAGFLENVVKSKAYPSSK
mmetsp:Transcript_6004/g.15253  ORF Transcript_6004/g.15253 Transcript_6004/m.15253 type:complete len:92 (+) Transcript_6004:80-355(+)|eukprot:CAMPEP_0177640278 /NCGR_PEP_ID=MMETSP0447-20121125/6460_1 /TAXON_ID=0 /ORGANISM="Stygamoeba regulata, Strain BSH-02190019" /LENGTH=91 /DNA_ID=CAMNT_0019142343 /DNA_START=76 /DNA_END=351 /DNA_ORIENTATION=+